MQLYERGLRALNGDINPYFKLLQIENKYSQPITTTHLMTQTSGITKRQIGITPRTESKMVPLEHFLRQKMPLVRYPPGEMYYYSNTAITLLGYLVEQVSGTPFIQYIYSLYFFKLNSRSIPIHNHETSTS